MLNLARSRRWTAFALGAVIALSACSGGGGSSNLPPGASGNNTQGAQLVVKGSIPATGGPQLFKNATRLRHIKGGASPNLTFSSVIVSGTIYQSDASARSVTNSVSIAPVTSGQYSAAVAFTNLTVHNNDWVILSFSGKASNGSIINLGELAGIVNVTANPNTTTLTNQTTLDFQVFAGMLAVGALSSYDMDHNATLASTINAAITSAAVTADPLTGLLDSAATIKVATALLPQFERDVVVTPSKPTVKNLAILRDYNNASELNLAFNVEQSIGSLAFDPAAVVSGVPTIIGGSAGFGTGGCGGFDANPPSHTPDTNPNPVPLLVTSCIIPTNGAVTIRNVYGGAIMIGATNNPMDGSGTALPFTAGFTTQAARAPGSANVAVTMASTGMAIKVTDPTGYAYGPTGFAQAGGLFTVQPDFTNTPIGSIEFIPNSITPGSFATGYFRYNVMSPYSATNNTITVDTFNPFNVPAAKIDLCGGISCNPLTATQPFAITRPFIDMGNQLSYRAWVASGTASGISQASGAYRVTTTGVGTATLTSTVATTVLPQQAFNIANTLPFGTQVTITMTDINNVTYTNSGANSFFGGAGITMLSVPSTLQIKQVQIKFPTTSASSFTFGPIASAVP